MIEKKEKYNVVVAGATGAVGRKMLEILEERKFPVNRIKLLASARSAGQSLEFMGEKVAIEELRHDSFKGCLLYTSPSPRDATLSRMPSSA